MQRRLEVETPEAVAFAYPLAGLGSRGLAALLDISLLGAIMIAELIVGLLGVFLASRVSGQALTLFGPWGIAFMLVALFATYWGYYIFGEVFRNGRTWGKRVMRIRVVREDGSRVGVLESVIRNFLRIVDLLPGTYGFGVASVLLTQRAQRLGDMAAGTVVIEESVRLTDLELDSAGELASLVRDYLSRRGEFTTAARWQVGVSLLATYDEQPQAGWDEPVVAGRLADLAGIRDAVA